MTECIAMAVGVILGAGCVMFAQMQSGKRDPSALPQDDTRKLPHDDTAGISENTAEREKLRKQWENFINYDGSEKGQEEIDNR